MANALAAFACAAESGVEPETALAGMTALSAVPGRMQRIDCGQDFYVFVDFAHTPDGLEQTLSNIVRLKTGKIYTVFGCGGDRDRAKRPLMARVACGYSDFAFITSDNPRTESPAQIFADITNGLAEYAGPKFTGIEDRRQAIAAALARADKGDIIFIAGKGHEQGQILADRVIPFCDAAVTREELHKLRGAHVV